MPCGPKLCAERIGAVVCLCVLIDLPAECRGAWRHESSSRSGIEKPRSPPPGLKREARHASARELDPSRRPGHGPVQAVLYRRAGLGGPERLQDLGVLRPTWRVAG